MDVTTLNHAIISLFIPVGWVVILYPFYTKHRFDMTWVIILVAGLSLVAMILKEFLDVDASINDIVADILGIFFGMGLAVGVLHLGERFFGNDGTSDSYFRIRPDSGGSEPSDPPDPFNLSDALCVGVIMTELGCRFYSEAIDKIESVRIQRLFKTLLQEKNDAARHLGRHHKRMRDGTVNHSIIEDIRTATGEYPLVEKDTQGRIDYAVLISRILTVEECLATQYMKIERDLPDGTGWKATPLKSLMLSQQRCVGLLESFREGRL